MHEKKKSSSSRMCLWECMRVCAWASTQHNLALLSSRVIGDQHHTVRHLRATQTLENPAAHKTTRRWCRGRKVWIHPVTRGLRNFYQAERKITDCWEYVRRYFLFSEAKKTSRWPDDDADWSMKELRRVLKALRWLFKRSMKTALLHLPCTTTPTTPQSYCSVFSFDLM